MFAIFPYLITTEPISIRGITFHSSNDLDGCSEDEKSHLQTLFKLFFFREDFRIIKMAHACLKYSKNRVEYYKLLQKLREAQTLIAYVYSSPEFCGRNPFGGGPYPLCSLEHSSLYLFFPKQYVVNPLDSAKYIRTLENVSEAAGAEISQILPGYIGYFNSSPLSEVVKGCRIYPPFPSFWLNYRNGMYEDFRAFLALEDNWTFKYLMEDTTSLTPKEEARIFNALEWHNRSIATNISEDIAIVNLAIAFESLLNLEQGEELSKRFQETVRILLGPIPLLESWLYQFYKARSGIIHEGRWPYLWFYSVRKKIFDKILKGKEEETPCSFLTTYGRRIFRLCLNTILSGAVMADAAKLSSLLVPNQKRLDKICKELNKPDKPSNDRILAVEGEVFNLFNCRKEVGEVVELDALLGAGKLLIKTYLATTPPLSQGVLEVMKSIIDPNLEPGQVLEIYRRLKGNLHSFGMRNFYKQLSEKNTQADLFWVVFSFVQYAAEPRFNFPPATGTSP